MKFWKYHGIGNDFILLDGTEDFIEINGDKCRAYCDRNFGIGGDGVLFLLQSKKADIRMRVFNSDGSEAEMCGNGIRCVAKHAFDHKIVEKKEFTVETPAGIKPVSITASKGKVSSVKVDMGAPILDGRAIPIAQDGRYIGAQFITDGFTLNGNAVSMGNPHFITFTELEEKDIRRLGPILERHQFFPKRTNVEFCRMKDGDIHVRVYERGSGWTLACGTGACAAATAAALNKLVPFDEPVNVRLPGGWLTITVSSKLDRIYMEGPAELIYEGNLIGE
ncbi:MAG: diaminopimelate epimerase [Methanomassiliicoccaceae archaeon]|nr:diaminopimelate epimerase [Methanomassiliicoccaceae archaeon]